MKNIIELAKAGKIVKVNFLHGEHKKLWGILGEWEGNKENLYEQEDCSAKKKEDTVVGMGYEVGEIDRSCFACEAMGILAFANPNFVNPNMGICCDNCPLKWTDEFGNPSDGCGYIYCAWLDAYGEDKKKLARMIRDMPLKDEAELFYNIVE